MRYTKILGISAAWVASCAMCFYAGFASMQGAQECPADEGGVTATVVKLPPRKFVSLVGEDEGNCAPRINVFRDAPALGAITSAKIWRGDGQASVGVSFRDDSGCVEYIRATRKDGNGRDWGLREDGSVEYSTVYEYDGIGTTSGKRQHYDLDGKPARIEHIVEHGR